MTSPSRSLPATVLDTRRRAEAEVVDAEACALCGALVDPDAAVRHQQWHDDLIAVRRIGEQ